MKHIKVIVQSQYGAICQVKDYNCSAVQGRLEAQALSNEINLPVSLFTGLADETGRHRAERFYPTSRNHNEAN